MANAALHREKIVQATVRLYREKGYANTGLNEILKLSGAPKGSLYHYFPGGKEELSVEAIATAGEVVANTLSDLAKKADSPRAFVAAYCQLLAGWMEGSRFKSGCPIATTVLECVPQSVAITGISQKVFKRWTNIVAEVFQASGYSQSNAGEKAEQVIVMIEGALLLSRVKQSSTPFLNLAKLF